MHVNFLGGFQVHVNGQQIPASAWKTKKAENLLKFLLSNRQTYNKETIAAILWPEAEQNQADASLRMALSHVRKALGLKAYGLDTVVVKRGMVYLNLNLDIYTDYELFNSLAQQAFQRIEEDTPQMIELLEQARDLYRGGFLPENLYDDWTSDLRRQLHDTYRSILKRLLVIFRLQGHRARALDTCRLYLTLDPCQEEVCRTAMQLLWEDGQKEQALHMYQELAASLDREYGIIPHEDTLKLYSKIRQ